MFLYIIHGWLVGKGTSAMNEKYKKHLTLEDREKIQSGIIEGLSKSAMAKIIEKDISTVSKEIKSKRTLDYRCRMNLECTNYKTCVFGRVCIEECPDYIKYRCIRRDHSVGACNGCSNYRGCRYNKFRYDATNAHKKYLNTLSDSRQGVDLTTSEAKELGDKVKTLVDQGHSLYQIVNDNKDITVSVKTLYNYIESGVFRVSGLLDINLRQKTSRIRKISKDPKFKKRADRKYLKGRQYEDYLNYIEANPSASIVQMDTVYNDVSNGPFIQTFKFLNSGFIFCVYHREKTSKAMVSGVQLLYNTLGSDVFSKQVNVILTDNGSEFYDALNMEFIDDALRTHIFYCEPMQSGQKGSLENKHRELRYILPKKKNLSELGLKDQTSLNVITSHVNSASLKTLNGKSSLELIRFLYNDMYDKLVEFGIKEIPKNDIILKPYLLKK